MSEIFVKDLKVPEMTDLTLIFQETPEALEKEVLMSQELVSAQEMYPVGNFKNSNLRIKRIKKRCSKT